MSPDIDFMTIGNRLVQKNDLILIRGVPGSGKTTLAENLMLELEHCGYQVFHIEADHYFEDDEGNYRFNRDELGHAHKWCRGNAERMLRTPRVVIVSNTFTTYKEIKPYMDMFNRTPIIIEATGNYESIHGVPEETMQKMRQRYEPLDQIFQKHFDGSVV